MSRRKHIRKTARSHEVVVPKEGEEIAVVTALRGSNVFEIRRLSSETLELTRLPSRFQKVLWIKVGTHVIVEIDNLDTKVGYMITHVLYSDQVKRLKKLGLWPQDSQESKEKDGSNDDDDDDDDEGDDDEGDGKDASEGEAAKEEEVEDEDLMLHNMNQRSRTFSESSSSCSD